MVMMNIAFVYCSTVRPLTIKKRFFLYTLRVSKIRF